MTDTTMIQMIAGICFAMLLGVLIQRRRKKAS